MAAEWRAAASQDDGDHADMWLAVLVRCCASTLRWPSSCAVAVLRAHNSDEEVVQDVVRKAFSLARRMSTT